MIINKFILKAQGAVLENAAANIYTMAQGFASGPDDEEEDDNTDSSGGRGGRKL